MVSTSKVLVVGPEEAKSFVLEPLEKEFSTVLYVPPEEILLEAGENNRAFYKKVDLSSFTYALILANSPTKEFYYTLARILSKKGVKTSIDPKSLLFFWYPPILFRKLTEAGIPVRKVYAISQDVASEVIIKELKLPVIIVPPSGKAVYVSSEETLKNVLSLFSPGYMIVARKPIKAESTVVTFASPTEVVAYEKVGQNRKAIVPDDKAKEISQRVREVIGCDFCTVFLIKKGKKYYVSNVRLLPPFKTFKEVANKDLGSIIASDLDQMLPSFSMGEAIEKGLKMLGEGISRFVRWMGNEIGDLRSSKKRL